MRCSRLWAFQYQSARAAMQTLPRWVRKHTKPTWIKHCKRKQEKRWMMTMRRARSAARGGIVTREMMIGKGRGGGRGAAQRTDDTVIREETGHDRGTGGGTRRETTIGTGLDLGTGNMAGTGIGLEAGSVFVRSVIIDAENTQTTNDRGLEIDRDGGGAGHHTRNATEEVDWSDCLQHVGFHGHIASLGLISHSANTWPLPCDAFTPTTGAGQPAVGIATSIPVLHPGYLSSTTTTSSHPFIPPPSTYSVTSFVSALFAPHSTSQTRCSLSLDLLSAHQPGHLLSLVNSSCHDSYHVTMHRSPAHRHS